jgi:cell division transport system permease protein
LRQNLTMTLAVIMTMWVSLSLFGRGLLASQQVELMKGRWYDKIEISIFLCAKDTRGDQCDPGQDVTQAQKDEIRERWRPIPRWRRTASTSRPSKRRTRDSREPTREPDPGLADRDQMQESFRVKLKNPEEYQGVVSSVVGLKGVQKVQDLHQCSIRSSAPERAAVVNRGRIGAVAARSALQIGNTIRLATFADGGEIGIMRLVGASNFYITVPFLLGAVISALIGVALACLTMAAGFTSGSFAGSATRSGS